MYRSKFTLLENLDANLAVFVLLSCKLTDLLNKCCKRIIIKPNPNSTADKIKKKNVKDRRLTLSYIKPTTKTSVYKVIHRNSAVRSKCTAVFTLITILENIKKNNNIIKFTSPKIIM